MTIARAYYNEIDPFAAAWLRELIKAGEIAPGDVDERDIQDVVAEDLHGYTQCHFFAGIGVWSYALRRAGWTDDRPVWTGSCPCQPFSSAGKGGGFDDERHLWPAWHHLIRICRPATVFGEQVASKDGLQWFDLVSSDMEGESYAIGAADLCAAGFGAPHIRQRLWFVADRLADTARERQHRGEDTAWPRGRDCAQDGGAVGRMADTHDEGSQGRFVGGNSADQCASRQAGMARGLANDDGGEQREARPVQSGGQLGLFPQDGSPVRKRRGGIGHNGGPELAGARPTDGFWRDADWLFCRDGRWRPVEPGTFPLVDGAAARVGRLRGYGNAIVAPVATAFVNAYCEAVS